MRVAIAHDYLTQRGGAERVVLEMLRVFPDAPVYTSLYDRDTSFPEFAGADIRTGPLDRVGWLRSDHRRALPVLPLAMSTTRIDDVDVVLASSSGWAHGVRSSAPKVVYCYNPARWLYQRDEYLGDASSLGRRTALRLLDPPLRAWDRKAAASASRYLAISSVVQERIRLAYGIEAEIVPPPAGLSSAGPAVPPRDGELEPGFLLCVSRLLPYKNVDVVIEAVARSARERLVVVGDGPERARLEQLACDRVRFVGTVDDDLLRWLYRQCDAVVTASFEDFGLTPLEALEFGKPSLVLRAGGFLDTVVEGETGIFFDRPSSDLIAHALDLFRHTDWDTQRLATQADRFGRDAFGERLREILAEVAASSSDGAP